MVLKGDKTIVAVVVLLCIAKVAVQANPCFEQPDGVINDYSGCRNYFECVDGLPFSYQCPVGYHFDAVNISCELEEYVKCEQCPAEGTLVYRLEGSCRKFVLCRNGVAKHYECPIDDVFDTNNLLCVSNKDFFCDIGERRCPPTGSWNMASYYNCRTYEMCFEGENLGPVFCPPHKKWFDINTGKCVDGLYCPLQWTTTTTGYWETTTSTRNWEPTTSTRNWETTTRASA